MTSKSSSKIRHKRDRRLHLETLERRELLAAELDARPVLSASFAPGTPQSTVDEWSSRQPTLPSSGGSSLSSPILTPQLFRWRNSTLGTSPNVGDPIAVTWSIVADGTPIADPNTGAITGTSNLIAFMDGIYGNGGTTVISEKPWFEFFEAGYQSWSTESGVTFVYDPTDDGVPVALASSVGIAGTRADMRIAGGAIDGDFGVLAFNFLPTGFGSAGFDGDMVIDTTDVFYQLASDGPNGPNVALVNIVAHEVGHGIGILHSEPVNNTKLMEPFINTNFYGPQEDDFFSANILYGDRLESNNSQATATDLGILTPDVPEFVDLISIDHPTNDSDWYRFEIAAPDKLGAIVRPVGSVYLAGPENGTPVPVDRARQNDLAFRVHDSTGATIATISSRAIGFSEFINGIDLPSAGEYFIEVFAENGIDSQAYELTIQIGTPLEVGPQLLAVRPDKSGLLQDNDVLNVAPREFNLFFKGGVDLNESTINPQTIRLIRSGGDGDFDNGFVEVELGYVGLVNPGSTDPAERKQVVMRPASNASFNATDEAFSFPDDLYRIQVIGSGLAPLTNTAGEAFRGGVDFVTNFQLDRGPQVVSIVPQPITRGAGNLLLQASNQIVVYFDDQLLNLEDAEDPKYFRLVNTNVASGAGETTLLPQTAVYDATNNSVTLTFVDDIATGTYRLDVGRSDGGSETLATTIQIGSLFNENQFSFNGYLGDINGGNADATDQDHYRVELRSGSTLTVTTTPHDTALDLTVEVLDVNGTSLATLTTGPGLAGALPFAVPADGTHFIRVSSTDGSTGSYKIEANVTGNSVATSDANTTFDSATSLGVLGAAGLTLTSQIQPQLIPLPPWRGGQDESGHREIQREVHIPLSPGTVPASGTTPLLPAATQVRFYHFPASFPNRIVQGQVYVNQITDAEKEIIRTIFEVYADVSGYEFIESETNVGFAIGKTDLRAFNPDLQPGADVAGLGGGGGAIANASLFPDSNRFYGDGFTALMYHEIGHSLGLFHSYELPSTMGAPGSLPDDVEPGDHDIVHLQRLVPPNSTDVDLYQFDVQQPGKLTLETIAERLTTPSRLDTILHLYREVSPGVRELVARNDRYFGTDSFVELDVEPGTYFVGVSSKGNEDYDPNVPDSGYGGTTDGVYQLRLGFEADRGGELRDANGTPIDGDSDGVPGGVHQFWFQGSEEASTIFVDRANDPLVGGAGSGDGSITSPFDQLDVALAEAASRIVVPDNPSIALGDTIVVDDGINRLTFSFGNASTVTTIDRNAANLVAEIASVINAHPTLNATATVSGRVIRLAGIDQLDVSGTPALLHAANIVRVVGNGGLDGNIATPADNFPYLIGTDKSGNALRDGAEFLVPQGVTVMVEAGTLLKMRDANLDAGTSSVNLSREAAAIQTLGTPLNAVLLRSYQDDRFGGDSDGVGSILAAGEFGGIVFRGDSDMASEGIFLNHVTHTDIQHGGGTVFVDSEELVFAPIHMIDSRPAVRFNHIGNSAQAGISANPNSFDDRDGRIGPDIAGNFLSQNTIDGLFIRVTTVAGGAIEKLTLPGRLNDTDITHVLTENLLVEGNPGGPLLTAGGGLVARAAGRLTVDPGIVFKLQGARIEMERGSSSLIAEGTANRPVIFTSLSDDRYGGSGSFDTNSSGFSTGSAGDWAGLYFGHVSSGSIDNAILSFGGGNAPIEGTSTNFNVLEVHQADLRVTNSLIRDNASGAAAGTRNGRGANAATSVYVRGSQPILVGNTFIDNAGSVININANSLTGEIVTDYGRSTGLIDRFSTLDDNYGPLVRLNRLTGNGTNGMLVRGQELTTESVWDDTDIVHVLQSEIFVRNHHTNSGLTLQSSNSESLVIKLAGTNAGFTASGTPLDIIDRVGGTIHVLGRPGFPVVLTHLADDTVGAGFAPDGTVMTNTNNTTVPTSGSSGQWRGFLFDEWSNDRNVAVVRESENPITAGQSINANTATAQRLGELAPNEKSGDETRRLGFEVHGYISPDDPGDVDVYSFRGTAGTPIWIDLDRTDSSLDAIIEIVSSTGTVLARSVRSGDVTFAGNLNAGTLTQNPVIGGDYYSQNFRDGGLHYVLQGTPGSVGTYFVRIRSNPQGSLATLAGKSSGKYELQIRLRQTDEFPGSTIRYADIRFASTAIDVRGLPSHSPLIGEAGEIEGPTGNNTLANAQQLVNILETDMAALSISGSLGSATDADWYEFTVQHTGIQSIPGVNDDPGTVAVVFDLDYADGVTRGDTTVAVYDASGNLIWIGRESNVADDQRVGPGIGTQDLSRGSFDNGDPFIGPIHVRPTGTYFVAVMSNQQMPTALTSVFAANVPVGQVDNRLARLEPINTVTRVVEDHIGFVGHTSLGATVAPTTGPIIDLNDLDNHIVPFNLDDVVLYVATDEPEDNTSSRNSDHLFTVNPFSGERFRTRVSGVGGIVGGVNDVQDVTIRSDGQMFGYQRLNGNATSVGALVSINTDTGAASLVGNDNISGQTPDASNYAQAVIDVTNRTLRANQFTTSDEIDALTFQRTGTTGSSAAPVPTYDVFYAVRESDNNSKLYRATDQGNASLALVNNSAFYGFRGDIQPAGVTFAQRFIRVTGPAATAPAVTPRTDIRLESKIPGAAGNFNIQFLPRPNNTNVNVSVVGTTILLEVGGTGGPPITGAPSVAAIVNAINNDPDASRLVTAVIFDGIGNNNAGDGATGTIAVGIAENATRAVTGVDGATGPLTGRVTGLSFGNFLNTGNLLGVTSAGEFLVINPNSGLVTNRVDVATTLGIPGLNFQGLTLGPQNVNGGAFANTLFAVTNTGQLVALDTAGNPVSAFSTGFVTSVTGTNSANAGGSGSAPIGLAFSPLDFNLWHPTTKRGNDAGHGINAAPDATRTPADHDVDILTREQTEAQGGVSLHFGFETWSQSQTATQQAYLPIDGVNAQFGIRQVEQHQDLSSNSEIANTYNFPGGALGTLQTNTFSLDGSTYADRPALYFNYFLETEAHQGSNIDSDDNDPFRDSARVFASRDGGVTWEIVATNSTRLSGAPDNDDARAELPGFLSHLSDAALNSNVPRNEAHQIVQELFDNTTVWRQARIDLSTFAGEADVRLRFDFSTAGSMNDATLVDAAGFAIDGEYSPTNVGDEAPYGEFASDNNNPRSIRSLNNAFEGWYIDDIIIGYAERGEMVTGTVADPSVTNLASNVRTNINQHDALPNLLAGRYQLEMRRTDDIAAWVDGEGVSIVQTFDTNDRHINSLTTTFSSGFEASDAAPNLTLPTNLVVPGVNSGNPIPSLAMEPWALSAVNPVSGSQSLVSAASYGTLPPLPGLPAQRPISVYQTTPAALGSTVTGGGRVRFSYSVSSLTDTHGLLFLVDGVPQLMISPTPASEAGPGNPGNVLASGELNNVPVEFSFASENSTLTWIYLFFDDQAGAAGSNQAKIDGLQILQGGTSFEADRNRERPQGMFIIEANTITDSGTRGINVQPGATEAGGSVPHPGSTINFVQFDNQRIVPGVVIQNNIIAGSAGIRFAGEATTAQQPQRPVPFGRIINNTLVGASAGIGVDVAGIASPTIMNNIITGFATGIGGATGLSEIRSNYFQGNTGNGQTGTDAILRGATTPLFVDAANGNFYLVAGNPAVDSSLNTLPDRLNFANFKNELGIPQSPIFAPDRDVFGQLRIDSDATPGGGGADVFKDRGAVDRADNDSPFAVLLDPLDNDITGLDLDPNPTVVLLDDPIAESFSILLNDGRGPNAPFEGTGVNPLTVAAGSVTVRRNNLLLVEGVDYVLGYNASTSEMRLTPLSSLWEPAGVYEITLDNQVIADRAGNLLRANQPDGTTRFWIVLPTVGFDFGDAPSSFGTQLIDDGARHALIDGARPRLGLRIDDESDRTPPASDDTAAPFTLTTVGSSLSVTNNATPQVTLTVTSTPTAGDSVQIQNGTIDLVFELVPLTIAPRPGNIPVRFELTDSTETIADKLGQAISTRLSANQAITVSTSTTVIVDEVDYIPQTVVLSLAGTPDGGDFILELNDIGTGINGSSLPIPFNADTNLIRAALENIPGLAGNVSVTSGRLPHTEIIIEFGGTLAGINLAPFTFINNLTSTTAVPGVNLSSTPFTLRSSTLSLQGVPSSGTFTLELNDVANGIVGTSLPIAFNATFSDIQTAIDAIPGLAGNTFVTGSPLTFPVTVEFIGALAGLDIADFIVNGAMLSSSITLSGFDDEDGVGVSSVTVDGTNYIVFAAPSEELYPEYPTTLADNTEVLGFLNPLDPSGAQVAITVVGEGFLDAWIDFNNNGVFEPVAEKVLDSVAVVDGLNIVTIQTPSGTLDGLRWSRFRLSPEGGLQPTGLAVGGEVEDFQVEIVSVPLPVPADDPGAPFASTIYTIDEDAIDVITGLPSGLNTLEQGKPSVIENDNIHPLTFTPVTVVLGVGPANAASFSLDPETGHFVYIPLEDFFGIDTFTYRLATQQSAIDTPPADVVFATVTIEVQPTNDAPLAQNQTLTALEDIARTFTAADLLQGAQAHQSPQYPPAAPTLPWDETNQDIQVYSLTIGGIEVTAANAGNAPFATPRGMITAVRFDATTAYLIDFDYVSNQDLNRDNIDPLTDGPVLDELLFTIEDDGLSIDPNVLDDLADDQTIAGPKLRHTATAFIDVAPQNDQPVTADDIISEGSVRWNAYYMGLGQPLQIPSEDTDLVIPAEFLLSNDFNSRPSALDELGVINDGVITVTAVSASSALNGTITLDTVTGMITYRAPEHVYGLDTFTYTITDTGISEDLAGVVTLTPLTFTGTVTVLVKPINDEPIAFGRSFELDEYEEFLELDGRDNSGVTEGTGERTITAAQLLRLGQADSSLETTFSTGSNGLYDEHEQDLRVVAIGLPGSATPTVDAASLTYDVNGLATATMNTANGTLELNFELDATGVGALVDILYTPNTDYNENPAFDPVDLFTYFVEDFGEVTVHNADLIGEATTSVDHGSLRSAPATVTLTVRQVNDVPEFDAITQTITFAEDILPDNQPVFYDVYSSMSGPDAFVSSADPTDHGLPVRIFPSRDTALDERIDQVVNFSVVVNAPSGMFSADPVLDIYGVLTLRPNPDAYGYAVIEVTATDNGQSYDPVSGALVDDFRSITRTLTIHITPVNDQPVTVDRALEVDEVEEFANGTGLPTGAVAQLPLRPEDFLGGTVENPEFAEASDFADDVDRLASPGQVEYDEEEQMLRVVQFIVTDITGATLVVDKDNFNSVDIAVRTGRIIFRFDTDGAFTGGDYFPSTDYNERTPFDPTETFGYIIEDFGVTTIPGADQVTPAGPSPLDYTGELDPNGNLNNRSAVRQVTITTRAKNDAPEFPEFGTVMFPEDIQADNTTVFYDIYGGTIVASNDPAIHGLSEKIFVSRDTAFDERGNASLVPPFAATEDLTYTFTTIYEPPGMFASTPVLDDFGVLALTPNPDVYGYAVFEVTATDNGQSYDPVSGALVDDFRSITRTLTIHITPVNDQPVIVDRELEVNEVEEISNGTGVETGAVAQLRLLPENFLNGTATNPEFAEQSDFTDDVDRIASPGQVEYDEEEQLLRVVEFTVTDANGTPITVDRDNFNDVEIVLRTGRIIFRFDSEGGFVDGDYFPNIDYNERTPFDPTEVFGFVVEDFGDTTIPGADIVSAPSLVDYTLELDPNGNLNNRSTSGQVTIRTRAVNDAPRFPEFGQINLTEDELGAGVPVVRDIYAGSSIEIFPSQLTALDELERQGVTITITPVNDVAIIGTPQSLFSTLPVLTTSGTLTLQPLPDRCGVAIFDVTVSDRLLSGATFADSRQVTRRMTINIAPQNDAPAAFERFFTVDEAVEQDDPTPAILTFSATDLLLDAAAYGIRAAEGNFPSTLDPLFNESEQVLSVVQFLVPGMADVDAAVDEPGLSGGNGFAVRTTANGGTLRFNFENGRFTSGSYAPAVDYNERTPFVATDLFSYVIEDDGIATIPGSGDANGTLVDTVVTQPALRSLPAVVTINVTQSNDPPRFVMPPQITILEDQLAANVTFLQPNFITNITAGPTTARDESFPGRQNVTFSVTALSQPTGLMVDDAIPQVDPSGNLRFNPAPDAFGTAVYLVTANDNDTAGDPRETTQTLTIHIEPVNDAPVADTNAVALSYNLDEDAPSFFIPLNTFTDSTGEIIPGILDQFLPGPANEYLVPSIPLTEGGSQTLSLATPLPTITTEGGTITPSFDGSNVLVGLTYQPRLNFAGVDTFVVEVTDNGFSFANGAIGSDPRKIATTITLNVGEVNDRPVANDPLVILTNEDVLLVIDVSTLLESATDPDLATNPNEVLTLVLANTLISELGAEITYDPATGKIFYNPLTSAVLQALGPDSTPLEDTFTYAVQDNALAVSDLATVTLRVSGVNDAPIVRDDIITVRRSGATLLDILGNDNDLDGAIDPATIVITVQPTGGELTFNPDRTLTYTPFPEFTGSDSFRYTVGDDLGQQSEQATVTINGSNAPIGGADNLSVRAGVNDLDVLSNDVLFGDATFDLTTLTIVTPPTGGTAIPQADGTIRYTSDEGFIGADFFEYVVTDSEGRVSEPSRVNLNVTALGSQNPVNFMDVSANGEVTAFDALLIINRLNIAGNVRSIPIDPDEPTPPYYDVNGDGFISAGDALDVIAEIRRLDNALLTGGEGEFLLADGINSSSVSVQISFNPTPITLPVRSTDPVDDMFGLGEDDESSMKIQSGNFSSDAGLVDAIDLIAADSDGEPDNSDSDDSTFAAVDSLFANFDNLG